jgi:hypothetical protein
MRNCSADVTGFIKNMNIWHCNADRNFSPTADMQIAANAKQNFVRIAFTSDLTKSAGKINNRRSIQVKASKTPPSNKIFSKPTAV